MAHPTIADASERSGVAVSGASAPAPAAPAGGPDVPSVASEHGEIVTAFAEHVHEMESTHGTRSTAAMVARYEYLLTLTDLLVHEPDPGDVLAAERERLGAVIQDHFDRGMTSPGGGWPPSRLVETSPTLIEFDRAYYEEHYGRFTRMVASRTVSVDAATAPSIPRLETLLFVVDADYRLLVYLRPLSMEDMVLGRNPALRGGVLVRHPMLVPERLTARAAGELVLVGRDRVRAILANNRSGNFRPPPGSAAVLRRAALQLFGLPPDAVTVFTVAARDGRSRPAAEVSDP
jgi:hypothetical protein